MASSSRNVETGLQLYSRLHYENTKHRLSQLNSKLFPDIDDCSDQKCSPMIEIQYTQEIDHHVDFLIDFIVRTILPPSINPEFLDASVILFNTEYQIDILQIIKFIEKKMEMNNTKGNKLTIIEDALKKLEFINCYTHEELEITCYNLENMINPKNFTLIILDNVLSQYWCENFRKPMSMNEYASRLLDIFYKQVVRDYNVIFIYAKETDSGSDIRGSSFNKKQYENLSYRIEIVKKDKDYMIANVTNFDKSTKQSVPFKINICPIFD